MASPRKPLRILLIFSAVILFLMLLMQPLEVLQFQEKIAVLFPKGIIALEQRNLLLIIQVLMLLIVIPVYILTFIFSWKYSATNPKGVYDPDLVDHKVAEVIWWGVPLVLTLIVCGLTWVRTHQLDPFKPLVSDKKPITIQVVALQWKWLFIYPEEKIASMNFVQFPAKTPIHFEITGDSPMNSFWIPDLAGQIYAMPKMKTELNLIADQGGDFRGLSANLSGEGFADMHFITRASSDEEYKQWIESAKKATRILNEETFNKMIQPSQNDPVAFYVLKDDSLFEKIIMKYMHPQEQ